MAIVLNIKPEVQSELLRQATAHGVEAEDYAATLLEDAVHVASAQRRLTTDQLDRTVQELAQYSEKIPLLPDEAFTRQ